MRPLVLLRGAFCFLVVDWVFSFRRVPGVIMLAYGGVRTDRVPYGWAPTEGAPDVAPRSTVVEVTLTADGEDMVLELRHTGIPAPHRAEHRTGSAHFSGILAGPAGRTDQEDLMSVDVQTKIVIGRPIDVVASYAADPSNAPEWYVNIESVDWETSPPMAAGSRLRFVARFMGRRLAYTYEVVELVPGERLVMRTAQGPFPMETTYTWSAISPGTTRMSLRNRGEPSGFSRVAAPMMAGMMRKANNKDLRRLKSILEGTGTAQ